MEKNTLYESQVNAFIPKAEKIANEKTKKSLLSWLEMDSKTEGSYVTIISEITKKNRDKGIVLKQETNRLWDHTFHREMVRLTNEANIRHLTINGANADLSKRPSGE